MATTEYSTEEWRPVVGYEWYEVSNLGRVRSLDHYVRSKNNSQMLKRGRILTQEKQKKTPTRIGGYMRVLLCVDKVQRHYSVHRLVLEAFVGSPPTKRHQINHKNGIKTDNRIENLEWSTPSENQFHAFHVIKTGAINCRPMIGAQNGIAKQIDTDIVRKLRSEGWTQQKIADHIGVHQTTVSYILRDLHWSDRKNSSQ